MIDIGFSRRLAANAFEHRATHVDGERVVYRLRDRSGHVALSAGEWDAIGDWFNAEARAVERKAKWALLSLVPGVFVFAMTAGQLVPGAGMVIFAALVGGPIAIYLWHSHRVKALASRVEAELCRCARVPPPPPGAPQAPQWVDIACMILVGPGLVIAALGEAGGPDTFRNTPLSGAGFGPLAWLGLALLIARLLWPSFARRPGP